MLSDKRFLVAIGGIISLTTARGNGGIESSATEGFPTTSPKKTEDARPTKGGAADFSRVMSKAEQPTILLAQNDKQGSSKEGSDKEGAQGPRYLCDWVEPPTRIKSFCSNQTKELVHGTADCLDQETGVHFTSPLQCEKENPSVPGWETATQCADSPAPSNFVIGKVEPEAGSTVDGRRSKEALR